MAVSAPASNLDSPKKATVAETNYRQTCMTKCRHSISCLYLLAAVTLILLFVTSSYMYTYQQYPIQGIIQNITYGMKKTTFQGVFRDRVIRDESKPSIKYSSLIGLDNNKYKNKYFIYRCDRKGMKGCGGWSDRVFGLLTSYLIANITGRTYKAEIIFNSCDMNKFLVPNQVNWSLPKSFHKTVKASQDVMRSSHIDDESFCLKAIKHFKPSLKSKYIYFKSNKDCIIDYRDSHRYQRHLSWMNNLTWSEIEAILFKRLFKPSPYLQGKVQSFINDNLRPKERLVCAHIRMGISSTIPDDVDVRTREDQLPIIWNFLKKTASPSPSKIFIMTDSDIVISLAKNLSFGDKFIFSPGPIVHIDRNKGVPDTKRCKGFEKLLFEQYILLQCDSVLISQSGLSMLFASLRETDENLFCPLGNGSIVACSRDEAREFVVTRSLI